MLLFFFFLLCFGSFMCRSINADDQIFCTRVYESYKKFTPICTIVRFFRHSARLYRKSIPKMSVYFISVHECRSAFYSLFLNACFPFYETNFSTFSSFLFLFFFSGVRNTKSVDYVYCSLALACV